MLKTIASSSPICIRVSHIDLVRLIFLAAIWGASFIGMRASVPELGTLFASLIRVVLAALVLALFSHLNKIPLCWKIYYKAYFLAGLFGAALPFVLFSYAAHFLPAALSALLNATCPLFSVLFSIFWLAEKTSTRKLIGLSLGVAGVWLLVGAEPLFASKPTLLAMSACLLGPACFAISGVIIKYHSCCNKENRIEPLAMATGSMLAASLILLPTLPFSLPSHLPSLSAIEFAIALALFPSAFAQIIFIPLLARIGPTKAMSVSFLIPLFSILWSFLFLNEVVGLTCIFGGLIVMAATALVMKSN